MHRVNRDWLYGNVKPYFDRQGIKLLRDDMIFIEKCLSNIPQDKHRLVMKDYLAIWNTKISDKEKVDYEGINPRYEANAYLRNTSGMEK